MANWDTALPWWGGRSSLCPFLPVETLTEGVRVLGSGKVKRERKRDSEYLDKLLCAVLGIDCVNEWVCVRVSVCACVRNGLEMKKKKDNGMCVSGAKEMKKRLMVANNTMTSPKHCVLSNKLAAGSKKTFFWWRNMSRPDQGEVYSSMTKE